MAMAMASSAAEAQPDDPAPLPERQQRQALGRRLRAVLRAAGWDDAPASASGDPQPHAALLTDLDALAADGHCAAWRRVVADCWRDEACRLECDRDPGLRTVLRRHATTDRDQALTTLLACRIRRASELGLIGAVDGRLWIADVCWDEMPYHLEIPDQGPGAVSPAQLRTTWLEARAGQRRAFLHHPRLLGGLPASGIAWPPDAAQADAARLRPLRHALAAAGTPGPFAILPQAELLAWSQPTIHDPVVDGLVAQACAAGRPWEAYAWREPLLALRQAAPGRAPLRALHALVLRLLEQQRRGAPGEEACLVPLGPIAHRPGANHPVTLSVVRTALHLLLPADALSRLPCALGWCPQRYQPGIGACDWTWSDLARCGWQAMIEPGPWRLVDAPPAQSGFHGPWLALPLPED